MPDLTSLPLVGTSAPVALATAAVLIALTVPIVQRFATNTDDDATWWRRLLFLALAAHLCGAVVQLLVVNYVYHNVADYVGYQSMGAHIAQQVHQGSLSFGHLDIPGDGMVGLVCGALFTIMPADALGGYFVFAWLGFLGLMAFTRALQTALPTAPSRRYAALIMFFPSLVFWPSATGKEALMIATLGLASLGGARLLAKSDGWFRPLVLGMTGAVLVRPHEAALLFGAFGVAAVTRRGRQTLLSPIFWAARTIVVAAGAAVMIVVLVKFLGINSLSASSLTKAVQQVNVNTVGDGGAGFGSSFANKWSPSPLHYPSDIYTVLLQPLLWRASGFTQQVAAFENVLLVGLVATSWRRLVRLPRAVVHQPYVFQAVLFTIGFVYLFSSFGNIGLLVRERSVLLPFLLVLVCLPVPQVVRQRTEWFAAVEPSRTSWGRFRRPSPTAIELLS